jgi:murein DD-endopeptidase MepM/ murein hydrolase activator NlpD
MTHGYTSTKTQKSFLRLLGIFATLIIWWLFAQPAVTASSTHQVFVTVQSGDTLYSLFRKQHISPKTLAAILRVPTAAQSLKNLHLRQRIRFSLDSKNNLESLALSLGSSKTLLVYRAGSRYVARVENGSFRVPSSSQRVVPKPKIQQKPSPITKSVSKKVVVQPKPINTKKSTPIPATHRNKDESKKAPAQSKEKKPAVKSKITSKKIVTKPKPKAAPVFPPLHYDGMIIHNSFYVDAKKQHIPDNVIAQVMHIFALQVNFKKIHTGDKLLVAYDDDDDVIAAQFFQGSRVYSAIQYVNGQGVIEYFTPDGESMKKAFNRYPVKYTHINSLFNMHRMHPVSHVIRPHTGVDLAGTLGTPVYSIGDGQVSFIGWEGAYGNIVKIQHNDKYASMYAHLLRFAPNLSKGTRVKRGQLIGYLGQTGNATGPHVHFEVRIYNVPVDPLTVKLPQASSVSSSQMKFFKARAKGLIAGLNYYQKTYLKS